MPLIPDQLTPLTLDEAIHAFADGYEGAMGGPPTATALACLVGHSALECGRWVALHNYNFGNVRPGRSWTGDICQYRCNEVIDGRIVWYSPPAPGAPGYGDPNHGSSFRAFASAADGARSQVAFLACSPWLAAAWHAVQAGDAGAMVDGLHAGGYFTGSPAPYRKAVASIARHVLPQCAAVLGADPLTADDRIRIAATVASSLADIAVTVPTAHG